MQGGVEVRTLEGHRASVSACAFSPDGRLIVSASSDMTLRIWDAGTGQQEATMLLLGEPRGLEVHPRIPVVGCGDDGGTVYLIELVGVEYGPIIVTGLARDGRLAVRCPACRDEVGLEQTQLGREIACPRRSCAGRMRINPFVLGEKNAKSSRLAFWKH